MASNLKNVHLYVEHDVVNDFMNLKEEYQKLLNKNLSFKSNYRKQKVQTSVLFEFFVETLKNNKDELAENFINFYREKFMDEVL